MNIGIVGAEGAKFTHEGEQLAKDFIRVALTHYPDPVLVSGGCHLGGVDIWAEEIADELGLKKIIHLPKEHSWPHYKYRNIKIALDSQVLWNITVNRLPPG